MVKKNKELILYLFFGWLSFMISIGSYFACNTLLCMNELIANIISWIAAVLFAFVTNRVWVFQATTYNIKDFTRQIMTFFSGRCVTLVIEEGILLVFVTWLQFNSLLFKIIAQFVVISLNYIISKFWIFRT